jgi:hypothetical protein
MKNVLRNKITAGVGAVLATAVIGAASLFAFAGGEDSAASAPNPTEGQRLVQDLLSEPSRGPGTGTSVPREASVLAVEAPEGFGESTEDTLDAHSSDGPAVNEMSNQYGIPYHVMGDSFCQTNAFQARVPKAVTSASGGGEMVYWYPLLFKWTTAGWQAQQYFPWLRAAANGNGYIGPGGYGVWNPLPAGNDPLRVPLYGQVQWRTFTGLEAGAYYGVKHIYYWENGSSHEDWSGYCQVS